VGFHVPADSSRTAGPILLASRPTSHPLSATLSATVIPRCARKSGRTTDVSAGIDRMNRISTNRHRISVALA
jgi:hypothetical protein